MKGGENMVEKNEPLKYNVPDAQLGIILFRCDSDTDTIL